MVLIYEWAFDSIYTGSDWKKWTSKIFPFGLFLWQNFLLFDMKRHLKTEKIPAINSIFKNIPVQEYTINNCLYNHNNNLSFMRQSLFCIPHHVNRVELWDNSETTPV